MRSAALALVLLMTPVSAQAEDSLKSLAQGDEIVGRRSPTTDPSITDRPAVTPIAVKKVILVGDSTTQVNSGWGGAFCAFHVVSSVACVNLGRGGRSTYSYRAEGSWDVALHEMKAGGYGAVTVLIQFGHNDQPGKPGRSTNLETEFPANLRQYVAEARAAGATPVLLTPLTRRNFVDGKLRDDLGPWAQKIRAVAAELNVPLVDLYAASQAAVQAMGPVEAVHMAEITPPPEALEAAKRGNGLSAANLPKPESSRGLPPPAPGGHFNHVFDYTHLGRAGAETFSALVADGLVRAVPTLQRDILP